MIYFGKGYHNYRGTPDCFAAKLRTAIKTKRSDMLIKGDRLLQDKAPVHNSRVAQMGGGTCSLEIYLPQYSSDLERSDFFLFQKEIFWKGTLATSSNEGSMLH